MRLSAVVVIGVAFGIGTTAHGASIQQPPQPCEDFLIQPILLKIQNRVLALDPAWPLPENPSLETWIVRLRTVTARLLPFGSIPWKDREELSPELVDHIKKQFGRAFRMDEMEEKDIYLFYANSIHSIYLYAVREWMEKEIESIWKGAALSPAAKNFGLSLMSRAMETAILSTHYIFPERAEEILRKKSWLGFSWGPALSIFNDFQTRWLDSHQSPSRREIQDWMAEHPLASALSVRDQTVIETGLAERKIAVTCCLTDPGCTLCPNNRAWLRKKPGTHLAE